MICGCVTVAELGMSNVNGGRVHLHLSAGARGWAAIVRMCASDRRQRAGAARPPLALLGRGEAGLGDECGRGRGRGLGTRWEWLYLRQSGRARRSSLGLCTPGRPLGSRVHPLGV